MPVGTNQIKECDTELKLMKKGSKVKMNEIKSKRMIRYPELEQQINYNDEETKKLIWRKLTTYTIL